MKALDKILHRSQVSEKSIEKYLCEKIEKMGGLCLKYSNPYVIGYPDRLCILPYGVTAWVELKSKGEKARLIQKLRKGELEARGQTVHLCDSREDVDRVTGILEEIVEYRRCEHED